MKKIYRQTWVKFKKKNLIHIYLFEYKVMKLGTKGRYAVMAIADIACFQKEGQVSLSDIAARQEISQSYLEQLLSRMRQAGIVDSIRGPRGGYRLALPADQIKISDIIDSVDENIETIGCDITKNTSCTGKQGKCIAHALWVALNHNIQHFLANITIEDLLERRL